MDKKWLIPPGLNAEENEAIERLSSEIKAPRLIAELLHRRGLKSEESISAFFNPSLEHMTDPYLFPDMDKAVSRILRGVEANELITIMGIMTWMARRPPRSCIWGSNASGQDRFLHSAPHDRWLWPVAEQFGAIAG
ncbi:MAG: hypothetical protein LRZ88_09580 [Candidatus Cloacimonetes bacterium]|nr:hypothetical protein [Candidatus Cloacimonadota bacterium]